MRLRVLERPPTSVGGSSPSGGVTITRCSALGVRPASRRWMRSMSGVVPCSTRGSPPRGAGRAVVATRPCRGQVRAGPCQPPGRRTIGPGRQSGSTGGSPWGLCRRPGRLGYWRLAARPPRGGRPWGWSGRAPSATGPCWCTGRRATRRIQGRLRAAAYSCSSRTGRGCRCSGRALSPRCQAVGRSGGREGRARCRRSLRPRPAAAGAAAAGHLSQGMPWRRALKAYCRPASCSGWIPGKAAV